MKILLAIDGSVHSNAAVEEVANRPFLNGTEVLIVSAYESTSLIGSASALIGGVAGYYQEADALAQKNAEIVVKVAAESLKDKNPVLAVSTRIINESPKHGILKEAALFGADLIVVGSHGEGALLRFLLGSVSQAVALHADCSVEIVRKHIAKDTNK